MKRIQVVSTALIALTVAGSTVVQAQSNRGGRTDQRVSRDERDSRDQRAQPVRAPQDQQRGIQEQQERDNQARRQLEEQSRVARQHTEDLQDARRAAEYRAQQEYAARVRLEQQRLRTERDYDRDRDDAVLRNYRYNVGGVYRQTNQYGADMLRQAVNNGYLEGVRAGEADRQNRWPPNYRNSRAFRDADDTFGGINFNYVDRSDYTYYFREGFQRGYDDGYYGRSQYGSYSNGTGVVLGSILGGILGLELIR
jgi:hypothetical protein